MRERLENRGYNKEKDMLAIGRGSRELGITHWNGCGAGERWRRPFDGRAVCLSACVSNFKVRLICKKIAFFRRVHVTVLY
jgi:hypothetical protein